MSSSTSNLSPNAAILDATDKANLTYIEKFGLPANVAQYIDFQLILYNIYINNPIIASDIEFNSYVL